MRYKLFGKSGLRVSELCLGAMTFGEDWGWGAGKEDSRKIFNAYIEAGGNFIDTANRYTEGTSEKYVGEFIAEMRAKIVLATKYSMFSPEKDVNLCGNHRKNMVQAVEASLRRLNTDYIDLYWVHIWDYTTPAQEVMRALDDLVRAGKILYVGISDTPAWIVSRCNTLAELQGWTPFVGLQIEYSLIERTVERELLPMARSMDIAVTPWAPLGGGLLTGKYNKPDDGSAKRMENNAGRGRVNETNLKITAELVKVAEEIGKPPAQVALNWLRRKPGIIIPIIGARTVEQLHQNLSCLEFTLSDEHLARLDEVSQVPMGFPHNFWSRDFIKSIAYGDSFDRIDFHRGIP